MINEYMALATFNALEIRHGGQIPFRFSREVFLAEMGHYLLQLNSPYKTEIDQLIQSLQEGGIINHIRESYISPKFLLKSQDQLVQIEPFVIHHVLTSLLILGGGLTLALAMFVMELVISRYPRYPINK